jgi:hypothetical protein
MMKISYYSSCHFFYAELCICLVYWRLYQWNIFLDYNNLLYWCGFSLFKENCFHFEESQLRPGTIGHKIFWNSKIQQIFFNVIIFFISFARKLGRWVYRSSVRMSKERKIRLLESNAKCRYQILNKLTCKGTLRQVLSVWGPLPS